MFGRSARLVLLGVGAALATGALLGSGCSLVTSYENFSGVVPRRPPPAPAASGGPGPTRVAAATAMRFVEITSDDVLGYDIDEQCTCPTEPGSCVNGDPNGQCDNHRVCIDNQVISFANKLAASFKGTSTDTLQQVGAIVDDNLVRGKHGVLIEISDWDGQPNDADITFSIMNVTDVNEGGVAQTGALNRYAVDPNSLYAGNVPGLTKGYVANNTVVVRGFAFDLTLQIQVPSTAGGPPDFPLTVQAPFRNALFVGTITAQDGQTFAMSNAQLTGALPTELVQQQLFSFDLCPADEVGKTNKPFESSCTLRDLSTTDPSSLAASCDAMSFAIGLDLAAGTRTAVTPAESHAFPDSARRCPAVAPGCR